VDGGGGFIVGDQQGIGDTPNYRSEPPRFYYIKRILRMIE
jgi:hypothetical protein